MSALDKFNEIEAVATLADEAVATLAAADVIAEAIDRLTMQVAGNTDVLSRLASTASEIETALVTIAGVAEYVAGDDGDKDEDCDCCDETCPVVDSGAGGGLLPPMTFFGQCCQTAGCTRPVASPPSVRAFRRETTDRDGKKTVTMTVFKNGFGYADEVALDGSIVNGGMYLHDLAKDPAYEELTYPREFRRKNVIDRTIDLRVIFNSPGETVKSQRRLDGEDWEQFNYTWTEAEMESDILTGFTHYREVNRAYYPRKFARTSAGTTFVVVIDKPGGTADAVTSNGLMALAWTEESLTEMAVLDYAGGMRYRELTNRHLYADPATAPSQELLDRVAAMEQSQPQAGDDNTATVPVKGNPLVGTPLYWGGNPGGPLKTGLAAYVSPFLEPGTGLFLSKNVFDQFFF